MSVMACVTRVRSQHDGVRLSAECLLCDVEYDLVEGHDVRAALQAFDASHPGPGDAAHVAGVPAGWRRAIQLERGAR